MLIGIGAVPQTATQLVDFQRTQSTLPMFPHGHPDPATLINAGAYNPHDEWSRDELAYIEGGAAPSSFGRDLQGVSNQIPQWVWLTAGGLFAILTIWAYRVESKEK